MLTAMNKKTFKILHFYVIQTIFEKKPIVSKFERWSREFYNNTALWSEYIRDSRDLAFRQ